MKKNRNKIKQGGSKMKANKKKIIVLVSLVVLLAGVACLNYFLTVYKAKNNQTDTNTETATPTFFATYRDDRTATRSQEILYLEEIMASTTADETTVASAEKMYLDLVAAMETEATLENLIKAYGFDDCIVSISDNNVNIVIKDSDLTLEETAQVLSIVTGETDYTAADVIVIPYV